jgi:cytoskeletal protein RodZ
VRPLRAGSGWLLGASSRPRRGPPPALVPSLDGVDGSARCEQQVRDLEGAPALMRIFRETAPPMCLAGRIVHIKDNERGRQQRTAMATLSSDGSGDGRPCDARTHETDGVALGQLLRRARERSGLTLDQISSQTKIRRHHLESLELDDLSASPGGFYRRAHVRQYARAVNLDEDLALACLERALEPPAAREAAHETVRETPSAHEPALSRKRVLIVLGVVIAAFVFGRAIGKPRPPRNIETRVPRAIDSPQHSVQPLRETPSDDVTEASRRTLVDDAAPPSLPAEGAVGATAPATGARTPAAANGDIAPTTQEGEARGSVKPVSALVVTTQPVGARVTVNGIGWGVAPVSIPHLPTGEKRIRVSKEGYATEERVVHLVEGERKTIDIPLRSAP